MSLSEAHQRLLLSLALDSIKHGLAHGRPSRPDLDEYPAELQAQAATFVTLHINKKLRGCIGHLESQAPLALDVTNNAYAAAFQDPRFEPLQATELSGLSIHISILSQPEALPQLSEEALLAQLRPGIDGLILSETQRKATFLPSVWEQLPKPKDFLQALKRKAGIAQDQWPEQIRVSRYQTQSFGAKTQDIQELSNHAQQRLDS
jgi:AmmeMemoRadiSam system protein A